MPHDDSLSRYDDAPSSEPSAEEIVRNAVDPDERILWTARPNVDALTAEARSKQGSGGFLRALIRPILVLGAFFLFWAYTSGMDPASALSLIVQAIQAEGVKGILIALAVPGFIVLAFFLHARNAGKFIDRAGRLTYGITDRRLVILLDGEIETEFKAEEVKRIHLRDRTEGFQDLILLVRPRRTSTGGGKRNSESLLQREKRHVGFKALPDAQAIMDLVEGWRDAHLTSAERSLEDFLEEGGVSNSEVARGAEADTVREPRSSDDGLEDVASIDGEGGVRVLDGGRYDLTVRFPEEWTAKVRHRRRPFGTVFLDNLRWGSSEEIEDWNVAKVEGPFQTTVEVHVDAVTEPAGSYEEALDSTLTRWVTGEVVSSDPDVRRGRFQGWSVTRRHQKGVMAEGGPLDRLGFFRTTHLHDGVIQLAFVSHWPDGSEAIRQAVDRVESNVTVRSEGVVPEAPGAVASSASSAIGFAGGVAGRMVKAARIAIGVLIFGVGVWAGYDQTTRAESYQGALGRLAEAAEAGIPSLPADEVVDAYDGQLVHLQGPLRPPTVTDTVTGLAVQGWRLVRTVELHQWQERFTGGETRYERIWSNRLIDSDEFEALGDGGQTRTNPSTKPWPDEPFLAEEMELGAWRLSVYAYGTSDREPVPAPMLESASLSEGWTARDEYLYRTDDPDVRVRYVYHPLEGGTHSVIGTPREGVLTLDDDLAQAPLLVAGAVTADSMVSAAAETERGVQSAWMIWAWIGLMILLRPVAGRFELFRSFNDAPFLRRQLLGAAISAGVVIVLAVLINFV